MDADWSSANDAEAERKRKERRREEAKKAINVSRVRRECAGVKKIAKAPHSLRCLLQLGNAFNGNGSSARDRSDQEVFNPYLGGRPPSMDSQQMLAMQMQMAQVNPAYMQQMHQYA
jgi:hypothetical protein